MTLPRLTGRLLPAALMLVSLASLASAYTAQYAFGILPCVLCLYQRIPFWITAALGAAALSLWPRGRLVLLALMGLTYLANAGIAGFHVGVEQLWWAGTDECGAAGGGLGAVSPAELMQAMSRPTTVRCDEPQWELFGVTFAGYNLLLSLGLGIVALVSAAQISREEKA